MSGPLPHRPAIEHTPAARLTFDITDEDSTVVFDALGAGVARSILGALDDDPATVSELADTANTSIQNAIYHLDKLRDAGLVAEVGTWYSEKGREMTVYGRAGDHLELRLSGATDSVRTAGGRVTPQAIDPSGGIEAAEPPPDRPVSD